MGEQEVEPEVPAEEVGGVPGEVPVQEGEKYDGGDIPRSESSEQEA